MLENLSPATIETLSQIIFGVIAILGAALGINIGRNRKKNNEDEGEIHEIKGAIISDAKALEILRVTEENTRSNAELVTAIHGLRDSVRDAKQEIKDTMRDFRMELRYLIDNRSR